MIVSNVQCSGLSPPSYIGAPFNSCPNLQYASVELNCNGNEFCGLPALKFTPSFSNSDCFTSSLKFSQSNYFSPSLQFSQSNSFIIYSPSLSFTASNPFTPPDKFTPPKPKIHDNIFYNVSIFSKEEIEKTAATITFFVVSTSVSIVGFIFYLNHRI